MKYKVDRVSIFFVLVVIISTIFLFILFSIEVANISVIEETIFEENPTVYQKVEIFKNKYGIPQIVAENINDAMFGVGFAQASDRLWQMDYLRRVASGELSEILGPEAIKADQYFRALQLKEASELVVKNLDSHSLSLLNSFANGVNFYINRISSKLPVEFQALNYKPKYWRPLDCILVGRLMAFTMNFSFWMDLTYFDIANRIGIDKTVLLLPNKVEDITFFLSDTIVNKYQLSDTPISKQFLLNQFDLSYSIEILDKFFPFLNKGFGSNTLAIQTTSGELRKSILASDPHLKVALPPIWYQIHITCSEFNVVGLCIPGTPFPLIGRNDNIAWGITNGMLDDCDFFIHKIDQTGKYLIDSLKKIRITFKTDTIKVKNQPDFVYYQRFIGNDIILSDFLPLKDDHTSSEFYGFSGSPKFPDTIGLTFKWTGKNFSNEVKALFLICRSKSWTDFVEAKKYWGSPPLNFSYADAKGNIGLFLAGIIPIRQNMHPNFPAISNKASWIGFQRLGSYYNIYNPPEGFIFNANNKTFSSQIYLSNYWGDPSRAFRILNLLIKGKPEDVLSIQVIQYDRFSEQAKYVLAKILPFLEKNINSLSLLEKKAFDKLKHWNFIFSESYVAPSIYQLFVVKFLENTLKDELGEPLFKQFLYLDFVASRKFMEFISDSSTIFFDDVNTQGIETKEDLIFKSFKDAVSYLQKSVSPKLEEWTYGNWHKLRLEHPFSAERFLEPSFSLLETSFGGSNSTINYAGNRLFTPEKVEVASSARFIADMSDTIVYWILPGGNSGQNMSKNYSDQYQLWLSGGYITIPMSKVPDSRFRLFASIKAKAS